jgi:hypothetical protein
VKRYGTGSYQEAQEGIFVLWEDHQSDITARQLVHEIEMQRLREDCAHTVLKVHEGIKDSPLYSLEGRLYAQEALREAEAAIRALPIPEVSVPDEREAELFVAHMAKQFHQDPAPVRCTSCPGICWEDGEVHKHWRTWQARAALTAQQAQTHSVHQVSLRDEGAGATGQCKSVPDEIARLRVALEQETAHRKSAQKALAFWMPKIPVELPDDMFNRMAEDAYQLYDCDDCDSTAEEIGWITLNAAPTMQEPK